MTCYIVSYDLRAPGRNYDDLYTRLKSFKKWGRITESTWAVLSDSSAVQVRDYLSQVLDSNDRVIVVKSAGVAAWQNTKCGNAWLKENI